MRDIGVQNHGWQSRDVAMRALLRRATESATDVRHAKEHGDDCADESCQELHVANAHPEYRPDTPYDMSQLYAA